MLYYKLYTWHSAVVIRHIGHTLRGRKAPVDHLQGTPYTVHECRYNNKI